MSVGEQGPEVVELPEGTEVVAARPPVLAATYWNTNADLIADCARLGYLQREWLTLDPTYGAGNWWTRWRPIDLVTHDLALDGIDFCFLPEADDTFDAAVFDPPYVSKGGRSTSGIREMDERYGQDVAPASPLLLQALINTGLSEVTRVVAPGGLILVKCKDYISSGKLFEGTAHTRALAMRIGLDVIDRLEHIAKAPGPQPPGRRQVHARRNLSTLFVFRKAMP